jgi:phosphohistidine phosphatase SixA
MPTPFRSLRISVLVVVAGVLTAASAAAQQAVIVVRHAERADQSTDSPLSEAGQQRARVLAETLRGAGVTAILTSEYKRTQDTAAPLAAALGVTPATVPARDLPALVAKLRALDASAVALVVGHSNTIQPLLAELGWPDRFTIADSDYDDLFLLVPRPGQRATLIRLSYGTATP